MGIAMNSELLNVIPVWCFFPLTAAIGLMTLEAGYRAGKWHHRHAPDEKETSVATMVASLLGLLAFLLAFTFSMAASRFDARRQAVLEEANAIGTTYLRTRLLPEPQQSEIASLLRDYTGLRAHQLGSSGIADLIAQSERFHEQIWSRAVIAAEKDRGSIMTGLFLQSLNESIDVHAKRVFVGLQSRIPLAIWLALFSLTLVSMASVGYQAGLSATRRSPEMLVLTLAFAGVLFLVVDLDRAHEGLLRVGQKSMINLHRTMQSSAPVSTQ
jgi:hypothetical protein